MKKLLLTAALLTPLATGAFASKVDDNCPDKETLKKIFTEHQQDIEANKTITFTDSKGTWEAKNFWLLTKSGLYDEEDHGKMKSFTEILNLKIRYDDKQTWCLAQFGTGANWLTANLSKK